jgi:hypothetical protein
MEIGPSAVSAAKSNVNANVPGWSISFPISAASSARQRFAEARQPGTGDSSFSARQFRL